MKGSRGVLSIIAVALFLVAAVATAQETLQMSVDKTVSPGTTAVKFDGVVYWISTQGNFHIAFTKIDSQHHRMDVIPKLGEVYPYEPISIQWGVFAPVGLAVDGDGGDSWMLGVETGYAEK